MASCIKTWYIEGQRAFRTGVDLEDCPYDEGTEPYRAWRDGWCVEAEDYNND